MKFSNLFLTLLLIVGLLFSASVPAHAGGLHPKYSTALSGPVLNGVRPSGTATVQLTRISGALSLLDIKVQNVNLPNGTILHLYVDRGSIGVFSAGTIKVNRGSAQGSRLSYPGYFNQSNSLYVKYGNLTILTGNAWR